MNCKSSLWFLFLATTLLPSAAAPAESIDGDVHEHGSETQARFGPDKGVIDAQEALGFKLNEAAIKNFKIEKSILKGKGPWSVPLSAIVQSREETHVYRYQDGYFKNFDVTLLKRNAGLVSIQAKDLRPDDLIAVRGTGFLMIVDQAVFGEELAHEH